jgi:hypothetical protein
MVRIIRERRATIRYRNKTTTRGCGKASRFPNKTILKGKAAVLLQIGKVSSYRNSITFIQCEFIKCYRGFINRTIPIGIGHQHNHANAAYADNPEHYSGTTMIVVSIIVLLIYQDYSFSITGIAPLWLPNSLFFDRPLFAELFMWILVSAFDTLIPGSACQLH